MSSHFYGFTAFLSLLIGILFIGPVAHASIDVNDESDGTSLFIRLEENSSRSNGPSPSNTTKSTSPSPVRNNSDNSGTGAVANQSGSSSSSSSEPKTRMVRRGACTVLDQYGGESDLCPTPTAPAAPAPAAPAAPAPQPQQVVEPVTITITSSDLLELIPNSPEIVTDRGPFGLKNAHTNFYASHHEPQTVTQTMFDQEVTITATPVEYRWDYGDGNTLVTEQPGYPVEIFNTQTDTSHQFEEPGDYTVELTTVFEGTFQVDGGEIQNVSSPVTQQADPVDIRIYRAVTRNVDQTCAENPEAWGCV